MSPLPDSTSEDPEKIIAALRRERDEALAREAALAEVLQVINSSPGVLVPVFDAILGRALDLCGAAFGYMLSCEGESFHRVASRGSSPALEAALPPPGPTPGSLAERFVRGENIICSTNLVEHNAYRIGAPAARALVRLAGAPRHRGWYRNHPCQRQVSADSGRSSEERDRRGRPIVGHSPTAR